MIIILNKYSYTSMLAATNFEPFYTRHAFPCYDEPGLQSYFTITIDHACSYTARSTTNGEMIILYVIE